MRFPPIPILRAPSHSYRIACKNACQAMRHASKWHRFLRSALSISAWNGVRQTFWTRWTDPIMSAKSGLAYSRVSLAKHPQHARFGRILVYTSLPLPARHRRRPRCATAAETPWKRRGWWVRIFRRFRLWCIQPSLTTSWNDCRGHSFS